jgi:hypothetical protein
LRESLGAGELARLTDVIAGSLHVVYLIAGLLAAATLAFAACLPAALSPADHRPSETSSVPRPGERRDSRAAAIAPAPQTDPPAP